MVFWETGGVWGQWGRLERGVFGKTARETVKGSIWEDWGVFRETGAGSIWEDCGGDCGGDYLGRPGSVRGDCGGGYLGRLWGGL